MTWPDYIVIVLCILLGIVESQRGFVVAIVDTLGAVLTVEIASVTYTRLAAMPYWKAYLVCVLIGVVVVAGLTTLLKRQTQMDIGSFDSSLGGLLGIISALVLGHAVYGTVILAYGMDSAVYAGSAFAGQVYEFQAWHGFLRFMSKVGTTEIAN